MTLNHFLLCNRNVCLPYLPYEEGFVDRRKPFWQTQAYANLIWDRFRKEYLPTLSIRQKWRSKTNDTLKEGNLVWLIEESNKRGYYNLCRVTETLAKVRCNSVSQSSNERRSLQESISEARPSANWKRYFRNE